MLRRMVTVVLVALLGCDQAKSIEVRDDGVPEVVTERETDAGPAAFHADLSVPVDGVRVLIRGTLATSATSDLDSGVAAEDAGGVLDDGGALEDAGAAAEDAGAHVEDAGAAAEDAGAAVEDAGVPVGDAGVSVGDAGVPVSDAGSPASADGGPPTADAGTPRDAGVPASDAGTPIGDAGAPRVDAGVHGGDAGLPPVDAGTPPAPDAGPPIASSALIYSPDRTQSPIDAVLAQHLRSIVARGNGRPSVFIKVGDSISASGSGGVSGGWFLHCMDGALEGTVPWDINVHLGNYTSLAPAISYFKRPLIGADDSWTRQSQATLASMTARWAITGNPSPLEQELAAANPRFAVVMYGSNDIGWGGSLSTYPLADLAQNFEWNMRQLTDELLAQGVVPLLTTMPPDGDYFNQVPVFTAVVRGIAQGRQVPLIDFNRELMALGYPYGLGDDHVHPTCVDWNACCWFDDTSLAQHGYNVRNLITLQALDRMRQVFDLGVTSLDAQPPHQLGDGSPGAPFVIPQVPWGELRNLRNSTSRPVGSLGCAGAPSVAGPQNLYRLVLTRTTSLRALLVDGGAGAQQLSLLSAQNLSSCLQSDARLITATLSPGTYYLSVNALSSGGGGEYNLSVSQCVAGDPGC